MKNIFLIVLLVIYLTACQQTEDTASAPSGSEPMPVAASAAESDCRLSLGWDPWEPYHFSGVGGEIQGLDIDLVSEVAERAGCELEFVQGSWAGLLRLIRLGELDLLLGATHTPEREEFAWFSTPYRHEEFLLYVRAGEIDQLAADSLNDLLDQDFRVGVTQGYIYSAPINELQTNPGYRDNFIEAAVGELNFTHLLDFRIDGFIEDPFVAATIQRRRSWGGEIKPLSLDFGSGEVHILFSRASVDEQQVRRFDRALQSMRDDGTYDAIMQRYLQ
jgi:polar amino acid transport system substrate-binding protein